MVSDYIVTLMPDESPYRVTVQLQEDAELFTVIKTGAAIKKTLLKMPARINREYILVYILSDISADALFADDELLGHLKKLVKDEE